MPCCSSSVSDMKRHLSFIFVAAACMAAAIPSYGAEAAEDAAAPVREERKNHFKFYGFIRNFFAFDTRESVASLGDLFYYLPKDVAMNEDGSQDLNAQTSFRFLALTSRLGVDVSGYKVGRTSFGAKVETDFYAGLTGSSGTAQLRLRQAYMTVGWDNLKMARDGKAAVTLKLGQAWHPMAADQPHVLALETGTPFNPFSRTPQVLMDASLGRHFIISAGALWQMQYQSAGPAGSSADYIKYGCTPEGYFGLTFRTSTGFLARAGVSVLSIKPRRTGTGLYYDSGNVLSERTVKVSDRITTASPYLYLQYSKGSFEVKAKTVFSQAGEHMNLMSGYGISMMSPDIAEAASSGVTSDGHYEYVPLRASSTWASISYGRKFQVMLMGGYIRNLGSADPFVTDMTEDGVDYVDDSHVYFSKNGFSNLNSMWRVVPTFAYNVGKFTFALELNVTSAQYGDYKVSGGKRYLDAATGLAKDNLHWVTNHRVQMMVRFTF